MTKLETALEFLRAKPDASRREIKEITGWSSDKMVSKAKRLAASGETASTKSSDKPTSKKLSQVTVTDTEMSVFLPPQSRIRTLEDLIESFKVDLKVWEVKEFQANKWENFSVAEGITELLQVKASFKRKTVEVRSLEDIFEKVIANINASLEGVARLPKRKNVEPDPCMVEISIYDAHFGKLCWSEETDDSNYDLKTACTDFVNAVDDLVRKASVYNIEKFCFIIGNDMTNVDSSANMTTKGTPQDQDSRYFKVVETVYTLIFDIVKEKLLPIAPVEIIPIPGNHDHLTTIWMGKILEAMFKYTSEVTVQSQPTPYKYITYGTNLLMFNHGDKIKTDRLPLILAQKMPIAWGQSTCKEIHQGHIHHQKVEEFAGVVVRNLRALCPADKYCSENGFVSSIRGGEAYIYSKVGGLVSVVYHTVQ